MSSITVCGTPRTGGNLLCALLRDAGVGVGDEWASPRLRDHLCRSWDIEGRDYWPTLWERRSAGGVFVVKLHWSELEYSWVSSPRDVSPQPTLWVFQVRRDKVAQGRSWALAQKTGQWYGRSADGEPDPDLAEQLRNSAEKRTKAWEEWFSAEGITPLAVEFESLLAHPDRIVERIVREVGH